MKVKVDFVAKAEVAWGDKLPGWVREWALEGNRTNGTRAAKKIGYSAAVFSHVLANNYGGDLARVELKVNGALMGATVTCPIVGEIGRDRCLDEQAMGQTGASSIRAKLYRACRNGCSHSRIRQEGE
ncbi:MAG: transcriptional regulator [Afipia sp.]